MRTIAKGLPVPKPPRYAGRMSLYLDLLAKGLFPRELPPPFSTASLSKSVSTIASATTPVPPKSPTSLLSHSVTRSGQLHRTLTIPSPEAFLPLASLLDANWTSITKHCSSSPISAGVPEHDKDAARALFPKHRPSGLDNLRAHYRANARFVLLADIADCYSSIYTHSLCWALHGRQPCKANTKANWLGNGIDTAM